MGQRSSAGIGFTSSMVHFFHDDNSAPTPRSLLAESLDAGQVNYCPCLQN